MSETLEGLIEQLDYCQTRQECTELHTQHLKSDPLLKQASELRKAMKKAVTKREREIRAAQLAPFHDEARRWQHGQKVYFGKRCHRDFFDWDFNFHRGCRVEAGDWCYVYQYQPKAKRAWLCQPKKKLSRANLIPESFSLTDIMEYQISRTEPSIRAIVRDRK